MSVARCERLLERIETDLYLLSLNDINCMHPPTKEQKLQAGRRIISSKEKIQKLIITMKKLNRLANNDALDHHPMCHENLRAKLTCSQDSILVDKKTIIKFQCILNFLAYC
ncbi:MAG: hypothetical protein K940chlam5_00252 [Candidatus Anoxychlamydiales bacterium]|nr:hypothetical protein [Candidatus Anoxychlamydiales bacterium]